MILEDRCTILQTLKSEELSMDSMTPQQVEREAHREQAKRGELVELIARAIRQDGTIEPLKSLLTTPPGDYL